MKNIDKKWLLFIMATVVSFYGICYTLVNSTFAMKFDMPIDSHFEDMNFYKCVVDSYNLEFSMNVSYNDIMDYDKLRNLSTLSCNKKQDTLEVDKIISVKGIEILTSLKNIFLSYNNISSLDLSNNLDVLRLDISYNDLFELNLVDNKKINDLNVIGNKILNNNYVYKGNNVNLNTGIHINSKVILNNIEWIIESNNDVIEVGDTINAKNNGVATIYGKSNLGYEIINNIHVVNITSDKYQIDELNNCIYIDNLNDFNLQDINCDDEDVTLELYENDRSLFVKYNDDMLKEFNLVEKNLDA